MSNETLIRCCAPTMACLKTGNMFSCAFDSQKQMTEELRHLNQRLRHKGLRLLPLRWRDGKALLYLYRPKLLERDLRNPLSRKLLSECGYTCKDTNVCLATLISRISSTISASVFDSTNTDISSIRLSAMALCGTMAAAPITMI